METLQEIGGEARGKMLKNLGETLGFEVWDFDHTRYSGSEEAQDLNAQQDAGRGYGWVLSRRCNHEASAC
jgi:hypothetical protein